MYLPTNHDLRHPTIPHTPSSPSQLYVPSVLGPLVYQHNCWAPPALRPARIPPCFLPVLLMSHRSPVCPPVPLVPFPTPLCNLRSPWYLLGPYSNSAVVPCVRFAPLSSYCGTRPFLLNTVSCCDWNVCEYSNDIRGVRY